VLARKNRYIRMYLMKKTNNRAERASSSQTYNIFIISNHILTIGRISTLERRQNGRGLDIRKLSFNVSRGVVVTYPVIPGLRTGPSASLNESKSGNLNAHRESQETGHPNHRERNDTLRNLPSACSSRQAACNVNIFG